MKHDYPQSLTPKYSRMPKTEAISPTAPTHHPTAFRHEIPLTEGSDPDPADWTLPPILTFWPVTPPDWFLLVIFVFIDLKFEMRGMTRLAGACPLD